ncbi:MAG TPA: LysR family transcriptional regulator [Ilumatobacteraceae bacterium]|nr:LysR family transcriptional regulator [Ilumatobacteraceae bacterium]
MELRQLRYFVAIAEERHFGRAAHRLRIATPTLSQQLRALERSLGLKLVDRTPPGRVTLTPSGQVLLRHARILLSRADRARDETRTAANQPEQVLLRLAFGAERLLAAQLLQLTGNASFGVVTLTSSTSDALLAVREESWDAAVVWDGDGDAQGLATVVLREVAVHLALLATHRLARHASVAVADLAEEAIVLFPRPLSPRVWDVMRHHLLPDGRSRPGQIITESSGSGPLAVLRGVAAGRGVAPAIAPLAERSRHAGIVLRPLNPPLVLPMELVWKEPAGSALQRVVAFLRAGVAPSALLDT